MKAKPHYLIFVLFCLILVACTPAQAVPEAGMAIEDDSPVNAGQPPAVTATGEGVATATDTPPPSTAAAEPASANLVDSQIEPVVTPVTEIEYHADPPLPPADLAYRNETYSFHLTLPGTWNGYQATAKATSDGSSICFSFPNHSPVCVLQVDVYSTTAWDGLTVKPPNYFLDENEQYVFAAGPYQPECVQLDDFQCARHREIPGILAGFVAESVGPGQPEPIAYRNQTYGFHMTLPGRWAGYKVTQNGGGDRSAVCFSFPDHGPICVLQVDVFTKAAWNELEMKPSDYYLDENQPYVFAAESGYPTACVQMDAFQCERYREIGGILASFATESIGPDETAPILYRNETYGFYLTLPGTWTGFQVTINGQEDRRSVCFSFPDHGPICVLQVDVFTRAAWDGLATKPPNYYLDENDQFVFAAGPYPAECVQLDDFQCARYQELPAILAGFQVE